MMACMMASATLCGRRTLYEISAWSHPKQMLLCTKVALATSISLCKCAINVL